MNNTIFYTPLTVFAEDTAGRRKNIIFKGGHYRNKFKDRSGFKLIGNYAVAPNFRTGIADLVRVEGRIIRHSKDLTGLRIHNNPDTAFPFTFFNGIFQLFFQNDLVFNIKGKFDISTAYCRLGFCAFAGNDISPFVTLNSLLPLLSAQHTVIVFFYSGLSGTVIPEKSKHLSRAIPVGIYPAHLFIIFETVAAFIAS